MRLAFEGKVQGQSSLDFMGNSESNCLEPALSRSFVTGQLTLVTMPDRHVLMAQIEMAQIELQLPVSYRRGSLMESVRFAPARSRILKLPHDCQEMRWL
ncbi:hypothetical protein [Halomicronema sp. CCY15110]|uniref:hypothetical protein n=1 Tax=Halomicronema sp. CCY15110 TaxID=2767773 RepID=UPI00194E38CB|nr:hypothetical protein [Halomicronema sp. CCY15110]